MTLQRCLRRLSRRTWMLLLMTYWMFTFVIIFVIEWNKLPEQTRLRETLFKKWRRDARTSCDERFTGYVHQFALLRNVLLDKSNFVAQRVGGEILEAVMHQPEYLEYFLIRSGAFKLSCHEEKTKYYFGNGNHLNDWMSNLTYVDTYRDQFVTDKTFTIAVQRYEYADLYRSMTDWYNAYVVMEFFKKRWYNTNILLVDAHPSGILDDTWTKLFNMTRRLASLPDHTVFSEMAWCILGYQSPIAQLTHPLPLLSDFRQFFLSSYAIKDDHFLDCGKLNILFIWRRPLVLHPRNPSGTVSGNIKNDHALLVSLKKAFPEHNIRGEHLEALSMIGQLRLSTRTDVLLGASGSGLTHALFLPRHAGVIQLFARRPASDPYSNLARARKLKYDFWSADFPDKNHDDELNVPVGKLKVQLATMIAKVCG